MRDSDWSRRNLLRCDWLLPRIAMCTTVACYTVVLSALKTAVLLTIVLVNQIYS